MILAPAAANLEAKRLLIVSDGALHYVPFAALPSPRDSTHPLIADYEIVNIPSASTMALLHRSARRSTATKTLAIFADPVFDRRDERVRSGGRPFATDNPVEVDLVRSAQESGLSGGALPRLPFTRREANAVLALVSQDQRKAALDFRASRKTALAADLGDYRIVHFATHGLLNSLHPELSGIVLSLVDDKGKEQRGFLAVADVLNMSLRADLVVLSGCRTALGRDIKGEGIAGLTRAFMYAGAPRVVASLWKVSDAATAELMTRFYAAMLGPQKLTPAAALRAAQRSLSSERRWSDPYYWAAFEIQGEWN
jgi:CHAT domain-containing protein